MNASTRAIILALGLIVVDAEPRVPIATRNGEKGHHGWLLSNAPCDGAIQFTIFLKQQNLNLLNDAFQAISDPDSPRYGKFLTKQDVDKLVAASSDAVSAVTSWLLSSGLTKESFDVNADSVRVRTTCATASQMFAAPFRQYHNKNSGQSQPLLNGKATMPANLAKHADFVMGLSEMWHGRQRKGKSNRHKDHKLADDKDLKVTPKLLRSFYGVPDDETNASPEKNFQAIAAFDDYFSQGALEEFYTNLSSTTAPTIAPIIGVDCFEDPKKPCDQVESDLDVQYITAMGGMGSVKTMFHNTNSSDGWVLMKTENLLALDTIPYVFSVSYGWAELGQCTLAFEVCNTLGYDAKKYVERTNVNFQKLATMGTSIFVSDGDDGAQGVEPSGWDPLDMDHWCPDYWSCYPKTNSKCGEVVLHNITTGDKCVWPVGHMSDACQFLFLGDFFQDETIQNALKAASPDCDLSFYIDGSLNTMMYSKCECKDLTPISHKGIVSEVLGDMSSATADTQRFFFADFPTSSPYVTSVGATVFKTTDGTTVSAEHVASIKDGAIITTGGGFSTMTAQPDYQKDVVKAWVDGSSTKPPAAQYDATQRGYPDITLNGHNYQVFAATNKKTDCPCELDGVDGTSASSPALAGMISLINGHLLAAGKSPLGFVNTFLYKAYAADKSIFNDITEGDNTCTRDYCMKYGYSAGSGWDPASGLGSINYAKLKAYALKTAAKSIAQVVV